MAGQWTMKTRSKFALLPAMLGPSVFKRIANFRMSKVKSKIRKLKGKEEEETRAEEAKQQGSKLLCCVPDVKGGLLIVLS